MAALGPSGFNNGGTDVLFPAVNGGAFTAYHFSQQLTLSRVARWRCGNGAGSQPGVELVFDAGVQGVVVEDAHYTPDGQYGGGTVDGCLVWSLGFGSGTSPNPGSSTITGASLSQDPGGIIILRDDMACRRWQHRRLPPGTPGYERIGVPLSLRCSQEPTLAVCPGLHTDAVLRQDLYDRSPKSS